MKYNVYFTTVASSMAIKVEAEDEEDAIEKAWDGLPGSLCHHCARDVDLGGEWEPDAVTTEDGETVWEEKRR